MTRLTLTATDNGTTRHAKTGDLVALSLPENPTTGYRWTILDLDDAFLDVENDDYAMAGTAMGSGGTRTLLLRVKRAGTVQVSMAESRVWDPETPINRFAFTLDVD